MHKLPALLLCRAPHISIYPSRLSRRLVNFWRSTPSCMRPYAPRTFTPTGAFHESDEREQKTPSSYLLLTRSDRFNGRRITPSKDHSQSKSLAHILRMRPTPELLNFSLFALAYSNIRREMALSILTICSVNIVSLAHTERLNSLANLMDIEPKNGERENFVSVNRHFFASNTASGRQTTGQITQHRAIRLTWIGRDWRWEQCLADVFVRARQNIFARMYSYRCHTIAARHANVRTAKRLFAIVCFSRCDRLRKQCTHTHPSVCAKSLSRQCKPSRFKVLQLLRRGRIMCVVVHIVRHTLEI